MIRSRTETFLTSRYEQIMQLEDQEDEMAELVETKTKLYQKKTEINSLLKAVENNIQPSEFRNRLGANASDDKPAI